MQAAQQYGAGVTSLIAGYPGQTQQTMTPSPSPISTALGVGSTLAGIYRALKDLLDNMSKIFRRPMFRKGGNVGEGIMSGIRENYAEGSARERLAKVAAEYPSTGFDPLTQFLIQGGLNLVSQPSTGGVLSDIATAAKEPTSQLFKGMAEKGNLARELALAGEQLDIESEQAKELARNKKSNERYVCSSNTRRTV